MITIFHPDQYAYRLEDSLRFDKLLPTHYHDIEAICDELWPSFTDIRKDRAKKKEVLGYFLANLKEGLLQLKTVAISRNKNDYGKGTRYARLHLSYANVIGMLDRMIAKGLVHQAIGYFDRKTGKAKYSRIWASKELQNILLKDIRGRHTLSRRKIKSLVVLRNRKKQTLLYPSTEFTAALSQKLAQYNQFMEKFKISYAISYLHPTIQKTISLVRPYLPEELSRIPRNEEDYERYVYEVRDYLTKDKDKNVIPLTVTNTSQQYDTTICTLAGHLLRRIGLYEPISPVMKAVFNRGSFLRGGRLYSGRNGWQHLNSLDRMSITFDGQPTVEGDFSAYHITMLYGMEGLELPFKPYDAVALDFGNITLKPLVKKMMLAAINTRSDVQTVEVMKKGRAKLKKKKEINGWRDKSDDDLYEQLNQSEEFWWDMLYRIKTIHAPISKYLCSDKGGSLMNLDSKIMMDILLQHIDAGIPCLPVHDSLIFPAQTKDWSQSVMEATYTKRMGNKCQISYD